MRRLFFLGAIAAGCILLASTRCHAVAKDGAADTTPAETLQATAQTLQTKLDILSGTVPDNSRKFGPIIISDQEANAYLKYHAHEFLPAGVHDLTLHFMPERMLGSAIVDFGEFSRSFPDPSDWGPKVLAAMYKGPQRLTAAGTVDVQGGQYLVKIQTVAIGSTTIPDWLVTFLLENYVQPRYKIDLSKPQALPDHVVGIQLGSGRAIFLRSARKGK